MNELSVVAAFVAGLASFLSPCLLPLVPGYVSMISGFALEDLQQGAPWRGRKALARAAWFVLGFTAVFCLFGLGAGSLAQAFQQYREPVTRAAGVLIVLFGLHFTGILRIKALYREKRLHLGRLPGGPVGPVLLGMAFAFAWTPCISAPLAAIIVYASRQETLARGIALMLVYSAGLGIPFLVTALLLDRLVGLLGRVRRHLRLIEAATGVLLIAMGVLIFTDELSLLNRYLAFLPGLSG